ncbi:MAG: hypothetical protein ACTSYC_02705 [Promethearchaeota archaeon]
MWIAIRIKHLQAYRDGLNELMENYEGQFVDFCIKWVEYYLDFADSDFKRFQKMNFVSAPRSKKIGKLEKSYRPFELIKQGIELTQKAVDSGEIKFVNVPAFFYYIYSLCLGAAKAEADLRIREKILEHVNIDSAEFDASKFRQYILKELKVRLEQLRP